MSAASTAISRHTSLRVAVWGAWLIVCVVLLVTVPYEFDVAPDVASAAASRGYHNGAAFLTVLIWALVGMAGVGLASRNVRSAIPSDPTLHDVGLAHGPSYRRRIVEVGVVFLGCVILYFPPFLAAYGTFNEDRIFLNVLHRMHVGQQPYVDFEFLYGPLMLYPAHAWMNCFGFSLVSYYSFLSLLVAVQYSALLLLLQACVPRAGHRYLAMVLLGSFVIETMMGVHQNGIRFLGPVFAILYFATRETTTRTSVVTGVLVGLTTAYSHDKGLVAMAALGTTYGYKLLATKEWSRFLLQGTIFIVIAVASWGIVGKLLLGSNFSAYVDSSRYLAQRFSAGEAGFAFYWSVHSLAAFTVLWLSLTLVAKGVRARGPLRAGEYALFAASTYALLGLKSGLNRSDIWHLDQAFLPLIVILVLPLPWGRLLPIMLRWRRMCLALVGIMAVAHLAIGAQPMLKHAENWLRACKLEVSATMPGALPRPETPAPALEYDKPWPDARLLQLSEHLRNKEGPVIYWGLTFGFGTRIGVAKRDYLNDHFMYSDQRAEQLRDFIAQHRATSIVIWEDVYERMMGTRDPNDRPEQPDDGSWRWFLEMFASGHYRDLRTESLAREERLGQFVSPYVKEHFRTEEVFGSLVVLTRKD